MISGRNSPNINAMKYLSIKRFIQFDIFYSHSVGINYRIVVYRRQILTSKDGTRIVRANHS